MRKRIVIFDAYNILFRAYYSVPTLTNPEGTPVNAVYGYVRVLLKYIHRYFGSTFVIAVDTGSKNFRHEVYPEYKKNRKKVEQDLIRQFPLAEEAALALHIPYVSAEGFEADDVIASIARNAANDGCYDVMIVSSDKDLMQLVGDSVYVLDPVKDVVVDSSAVKEKFGVFPEQMVDYLALVGDASDNIKGVKGIGSKTAKLLLNNFRTVEEMLESDVCAVDKKLSKALSMITEDVFFYKKLVSLSSEVQVDVEYNELSVNEGLIKDFKLFMSKNSFGSLSRKFDSIVKKTKDAEIYQDNSAVALQGDDGSFSEVSQFIEKMKEGLGIVAIDFVIESDSLESIYLCDGSNAAICVRGNGVDFIINRVFNDHSVVKVVFDIQAVLHLLPPQISLQSVHDVCLMFYSANTVPGLSFDQACNELGVDNAEPVRVRSMLALFSAAKENLIEKSLISVYELLDRPMLDILQRITLSGVTVDEAELETLEKEFLLSAADLEEKIYQLSGKEFNIGSTQQLAQVLIDIFGVKLSKNARTGNFKTDADAMDYLASQGHDVARYVLEWRFFKKLVNTYTKGLHRHISKDTARIHSRYLVTTTSTGRLSSSHPNLQNIPIKSQTGRRIRRSFVARENRVLISADYTQIELRLLAHIAKERLLIEELNKGIDLHSLTASQIFGVQMECVTSEMRMQAKSINFGIIYGITPFGLAKQLSISQNDAASLINTYFKKYPSIPEYIESAKSSAKIHGYVTTIFNRRCYINGISSKNHVLRQLAERSAINAPIQGSAADIIKKAMIKLDALMRIREIDAQMKMQIHDELVFEVEQG